MKVTGDANPGIFSVYKQPNNPKKALARFYENVTPYSNDTYSGFQYDEYQLELNYYPGLANDIGKNITPYLTRAKQLEEKKLFEQQFEQIVKQSAADIAYISMMTEVELDG